MTKQSSIPQDAAGRLHPASTAILIYVSCLFAFMIYYGLIEVQQSISEVETKTFCPEGTRCSSQLQQLFPLFIITNPINGRTWHTGGPIPALTLLVLATMLTYCHWKAIMSTRPHWPVSRPVGTLSCILVSLPIVSVAYGTVAKSLQCLSLLMLLLTVHLFPAVVTIMTMVGVFAMLWLHAWDAACDGVAKKLCPGLMENDPSAPTERDRTSHGKDTSETKPQGQVKEKLANSNGKSGSTYPNPAREPKHVSSADNCLSATTNCSCGCNGDLKKWKLNLSSKLRGMFDGMPEQSSQVKQWASKLVQKTLSNTRKRFDAQPPHGGFDFARWGNGPSHQNGQQLPGTWPMDPQYSRSPIPVISRTASGRFVSEGNNGHSTGKPSTKPRPPPLQLSADSTPGSSSSRSTAVDNETEQNAQPYARRTQSEPEPTRKTSPLAQKESSRIHDIKVPSPQVEPKKAPTQGSVPPAAPKSSGTSHTYVPPTQSEPKPKPPPPRVYSFSQPTQSSQQKEHVPLQRRDTGGNVPKPLSPKLPKDKAQSTVGDSKVSPGQQTSPSSVQDHESVKSGVPRQKFKEIPRNTEQDGRATQTSQTSDEKSQGKSKNEQTSSKRPRPRSAVDLGEDDDVLRAFMEFGEGTRPGHTKREQEAKKSTSANSKTRESGTTEASQKPQSQTFGKPSKPSRPTTDSGTSSSRMTYSNTSRTSTPVSDTKTSSTLNEEFDWFDFVEEESLKSEPLSSNKSTRRSLQGSSYSSSSKGSFRTGRKPQPGPSRTSSGSQKSPSKPKPKPKPKPEPKSEPKTHPRPYGQYDFNARSGGTYKPYRPGNSPPPREQTFNTSQGQSQYSRPEYNSAGAQPGQNHYGTYSSYPYSQKKSGQGEQSQSNLRTGYTSYTYYAYYNGASGSWQQSQQPNYQQHSQQSQQQSQQQQRKDSQRSQGSQCSQRSQNSQRRSNPQPSSSRPNPPPPRPSRPTPPTTKDSFNPYTTLSLPHTAALAEIRRAYKKLSVKHHPDKAVQQGGVSQEDAEAKMKDLNRAKEILCDNVVRYVFNSEGLEMAENARYVEKARVRIGQLGVGEREFEEMFVSGKW